MDTLLMFIPHSAVGREIEVVLSSVSTSACTLAVLAAFTISLACFWYAFGAHSH